MTRLKLFANLFGIDMQMQVPTEGCELGATWTRGSRLERPQTSGTQLSQVSGKLEIIR